MSIIICTSALVLILVFLVGYWGGWHDCLRTQRKLEQALNQREDSLRNIAGALVRFANERQ